jgi:hypothetical protein
MLTLQSYMFDGQFFVYDVINSDVRERLDCMTNHCLRYLVTWDPIDPLGFMIMLI